MQEEESPQPDGHKKATKKPRSNTLRWSILFTLLLIYIAAGYLRLHEQILHAETQAKSAFLVDHDHQVIARLLSTYPEIVLFTEAEGTLKVKAFYSAQAEFLPSAVIPLGKEAGSKYIANYLLLGKPVVFDFVPGERRVVLLEEVRKRGVDFTKQKFGGRFLVLLPKGEQP